MFFSKIKFLFSIFSAFLSFSIAQAECVDLSGSWTCKVTKGLDISGQNDQGHTFDTEIIKSADDKGNPIYDYDGENGPTYVADEGKTIQRSKENPLLMYVVKCDERALYVLPQPLPTGQQVFETTINEDGNLEQKAYFERDGKDAEGNPVVIRTKSATGAELLCEPRKEDDGGEATEAPVGNA